MRLETLFKYFRGESSEKEKEKIGRWLAASEDAYMQYERAQFLFEGAIVNAGGATAGGGKRKRFLKTAAGCFAAAAAAAAIFLCGAHFARRNAPSSVSSPMTAETLPGQRATVTLSDGTRVHLNSGTRLEYPVLFSSGERRVVLSGEAMFEVAKDASKPFIVSTFASDITVLGTKFNVRAAEDEGEFSAILTEGAIRITGKADGSSTDMVPGEMIALSGGRLQKIPRVESSLCWIDGNVDLKADSFQALVKRLENAYGVEITIERTELPSVAGLSGQIRISEGVEHAFKTLQHVLDFRYEIEDTTGRVNIY